MSSFVDHLLGLLAGFAPVRAKRMFGGYGLYVDDLMFGIVIDDVLYLKVDDGNRARYLERELPPFEYEAKGKRVSLSYFRAPEELFDESEVAIDWAREAYAAALRTRAGKARREKPSAGKKLGTRKASR